MIEWFEIKAEGKAFAIYRIWDGFCCSGSKQEEIFTTLKEAKAYLRKLKATVKSKGEPK